MVLVPPNPSEAAMRANADWFGDATRTREVAVETVGREAARPLAFAAAYLTKDVAATDRPSPHAQAQAQRALRGTQDATNLKRIVLPAGALETVRPEALWQTGERMGVTGQTGAPDLRALLGSCAQAPGMTTERLRARLAQLKDMVAARRLALARISGAQRARRPSLGPDQADPPAADVADSPDAPPQDPVEDLVRSSNRRVQDAADGVAGMHQRLTRSQGIKKQ